MSSDLSDTMLDIAVTFFYVLPSYIYDHLVRATYFIWLYKLSVPPLLTHSTLHSSAPGKHLKHEEIIFRVKCLPNTRSPTVALRRMTCALRRLIHFMLSKALALKFDYLCWRPTTTLSSNDDFWSNIFFRVWDCCAYWWDVTVQLSGV